MDAHAQLLRLLRALLLACERPLEAEQVVALIAQAVDEEEWPAPVTRQQVEAALAELRRSWDGADGVELLHAGEGYRLRTAPDLGSLVRRMWPERAVRLSRAALEALSVVAYRQPCTRLDVEDVRGVDSGGVLRSLMDRRLLRIVGRKDEPGRPLLYGTTPEFLETFSLPSLRALPTLRDLAQMRLDDAALEQAAAPPEHRTTPDEAADDMAERPPDDA